MCPRPARRVSAPVRGGSDGHVAGPVRFAPVSMSNSDARLELSPRRDRLSLQVYRLATFPSVVRKACHARLAGNVLGQPM